MTDLCEEAVAFGLGVELRVLSTPNVVQELGLGEPTNKLSSPFLRLPSARMKPFVKCSKKEGYTIRLNSDLASST